MSAGGITGKVRELRMVEIFSTIIHGGFMKTFEQWSEEGGELTVSQLEKGCSRYQEHPVQKPPEVGLYWV